MPSAAVFPHGMSAAAAGLSLVVAKKKEFSKSPSNSPASSGGTDGGSSVVLWPEQLHAQNGAPTRVEAMEPVITLTACANSVAAYNHDATDYYLAWLGEMVYPWGPHRCTAWLPTSRRCPHCAWCACGPRCSTLARRVSSPTAPSPPPTQRCHPDPRFLHFTLNERVLCAFDGHDCVHVIDFDIKQGLQWPSLLQILTMRAAP